MGTTHTDCPLPVPNGDQSGAPARAPDWGERLAPSEWPADGSQRRPRILLVDDSSDLGDLMTTLLEEEHYSVVVSRSLATATLLLAHLPFDLVLTDGFSHTPAAVVTATAGLRRAAGRTPVVLFSGHHLERDELQTAGFRDRIGKPFDLDTMLEQVRTLLRATMHGW